MAAGAVSGGTPTFNMPSASETALPAPPPNADETYYKEAAKVHHTLETTLSGDKETFENDERGYNYQKALLAKAEPERFAANRYRGVREGISESGIQGNRIQGITGDFALKNARALELYSQNVKKLNVGAQNAVAGQGYDIGLLAAGSNKRYLEETLRNKPQTPEPAPAAPAYPILPAQQAAINAGVPAGPGGVVPYGFGTGNVRVGPATASIRRAAATKARKR